MLLLFLLCYLLDLHSPTLASSADVVFNEIASASGNLTALRHEIAPCWVSSLNFRSTSDILWSCIVTLVACVYTAVHLNVPPIHETKWQFVWRKARWVAMALFAPEIVLYTAYSQYVEARDLVKELNRIRFGEENGSSDDTEKGISSANGPRSGAGALDATERYGLRYGFFIVMGGCITRDVEKELERSTHQCDYYSQRRHRPGSRGLVH